MRVGRFLPWLMVTATALGGAGIGPVLAQNAIKEPGWPPPEGAACKPTKVDLDQAKTLFELGDQAWKISNFPDAIKYWKDGYRKACDKHIFLKNLGKALAADGQITAAIEVYQLYRVRAKPTGEELDQLDATIGNLQKKVGTTATTTAPTGTGTTAPTGTGTAPTGTNTAPTGTTTAPTGTATTAPTGTVPPSGGSKALPIGLMAGGGAVAVVGGILWVVENGKVKTAAKDWETYSCASGANTAKCQSIASDGNGAKSSRTIGIVMTGVGVVAAGVGVGLYVMGSDKKKDAASIQITPGPGFAGIGLTGSF
jgi:hypothetical protein